LWHRSRRRCLCILPQVKLKTGIAFIAFWSMPGQVRSSASRLAVDRQMREAMAMRLLVVEDDPDLNRQLTTALTDAGYVVDTVADGEEGHFLGDTEPYDAIILDLGLPVMDGVTVLEKWRRSGRKMPVLILTARDRWSDKVAGFDAGADDYVSKPFHMEEVLARVQGALAPQRGARHQRDQLRPADA
jgi:DNA-binding response OmpR family regulator